MQVCCESYILQHSIVVICRILPFFFLTTTNFWLPKSHKVWNSLSFKLKTLKMIVKCIKNRQIWHICRNLSTFWPLVMWFWYIRLITMSQNKHWEKVNYIDKILKHTKSHLIGHSCEIGFILFFILC